MPVRRNPVREMKRRNLLLAGFASLLILAGLLLIYTGYRLKWQENRIQGRLRSLYAEQVASGVRPELDSGLDDLLELPRDDEKPEGPVRLSDLRPFGLLTIPSIDLEVVMVEGITPADLRFAVGHFPGTGEPGPGGNVALAGHRTFTSGQFFRRLDELEEGDEIRIEYGGELYPYRVTDKWVVNPEDTWVLDKTEEAAVTLVTCTPPHSTAYRLVIRGLLQESP